MVKVITHEIENAGFDPSVVAELRAAAETAWRQFATEQGDWASKTMTLWIEPDSSADARHVRLAVGSGGRYGTVRAGSPSELRTALVAHLRTWFCGTAMTDTRPTAAPDQAQQ